MLKLSKGWTTHISNICKLSVDYPSTWTIIEKQGRFDTTVNGKLQISTNNTAKGDLPYIHFVFCDLRNDLGSLLDETNALQNALPFTRIRIGRTFSFRKKSYRW